MIHQRASSERSLDQYNAFIENQQATQRETQKQIAVGVELGQIKLRKYISRARGVEEEEEEEARGKVARPPTEAAFSSRTAGLASGGPSPSPERQSDMRGSLSCARPLVWATTLAPLQELELSASAASTSRYVPSGILHNRPRLRPGQQFHFTSHSGTRIGLQAVFLYWRSTGEDSRRLPSWRLSRS